MKNKNKKDGGKKTMLYWRQISPGSDIGEAIEIEYEEGMTIPELRGLIDGVVKARGIMRPSPAST